MLRGGTIEKARNCEPFVIQVRFSFLRCQAIEDDIVSGNGKRLHFVQVLGQSGSAFGFVSPEVTDIVNLGVEIGAALRHFGVGEAEVAPIHQINAVFLAAVQDADSPIAIAKGLEPEFQLAILLGAILQGLHT